MKKLSFIYFLGVLVSVTLISSGCVSQHKNQVVEITQTIDNFELKSANILVKNYMNYLKENQLENAKNLYSKDLYDKSTQSLTTDLKIRSFSIDAVDEVGKSAIFKVIVSKSSNDRSITVVDLYAIKVIKDVEDYKISKIEYTPVKSVFKDKFLDTYQIRQRVKNEAKTSLIIDNRGIPLYGFSKGDLGKINEIPISSTNFDKVDLDFKGEHLAFSTEGEKSFIGIVSIDDSLSESSSGGGAKEGDGGATKATPAISQETSIGKNITYLDVYDKCRVDYFVFSEESKFVACQYTKEGGYKSLKIYKVASGDVIPINLEEEYEMGKVEIIFNGFDEKKVNYEIKSLSDDVKTLEGNWQLDLESLITKRL